MRVNEEVVARITRTLHDAGITESTRLVATILIHEHEIDLEQVMAVMEDFFEAPLWELVDHYAIRIPIEEKGQLMLLARGEDSRDETSFWAFLPNNLDLRGFNGTLITMIIVTATLIAKMYDLLRPRAPGEELPVVFSLKGTLQALGLE